MPVLRDRTLIEAALEKQMVQYRREKAEFPSEYGAMMLDLGESRERDLWHLEFE